MFTFPMMATSEFQLRIIGNLQLSLPFIMILDG